jgi:hypothetical protein
VVFAPATALRRVIGTAMTVAILRKCQGVSANQGNNRGRNQKFPHEIISTAP